jgi:hypothetical protein
MEKKDGGVAEGIVKKKRKIILANKKSYFEFFFYKRSDTGVAWVSILNEK